jgi:Xaa-Pro aminopeptidase
MNAENKPALIQARLAQLRAKMRSNQVDFAVVPSSDPHISEYLPERWKSREWLSGFTGSMGTLVVGLGEAAIFADSRYWVAAEAELAGTSVTLVKIPTGSASYHLDWLAQRCEPGQTIAVDGTVMGLAAARALQTTAQDSNVTLRTDLDLLDTVWENRPSLPLVHVYEHNALKAGQTRAEKLALIRAQMQKLGATHHFVSTLDDIAWLLNLRGQDVDYNPVFLAHALIDQTQLALFIDPRKIDPALSRLLAQDGVLIEPYEQALDSLSAVPAGATVLVDPKRITLD